MQETYMAKILQLCRQTDETARDIYSKLSLLSLEKELSLFWEQMSEEESQHVSFWQHAEQLEELSGLPELFENPDQVINELEKALLRSKEMLAKCEDDNTVSKAFMLAFRMEFYLLHPAFELLFHYLGSTAEVCSPEEDYESHIAKFISMLGKHGNVTPELELLGETIERLWKENRKLAIQSTRDDLTGVLNRRGFFAISVQFAQLAQRTQSTLGVIMIDLDNFKTINDRFGHPVGDSVLKITAQQLTKALRSSDLVGRYGGEEFIVLLPNVASGSTAMIAEDIRKAVEKTNPDGILVTVSIGFVEASLGDDVQHDYKQMISNADIALNQAKSAGKNRVIEFKS